MGGMRVAVVVGVEAICWKLELCFGNFCFRLERTIKNAKTTARMPRKATPPTTPPTIAAVFLLPPLLLPLLDTEDDVLVEGGREDSVPRILSARVTLNESEPYESSLAVLFTMDNQNTVPKHSDKRRLAP